MHDDIPVLKKRAHLQRVVKRAVPLDVSSVTVPSTTTSAVQTSPSTQAVTTQAAATTQNPNDVTPTINRPPITDPDSPSSSSSTTTSKASSGTTSASTTGTTSSSSATSSSTSTSSATTPATLSTTSPTLVHTTVAPEAATTVSKFIAASGTVASSAAATTTAASSSGVSTAGIIGIAAAGVVGAAVLAGLVMFLLRRWSRRNDEDFDPVDFKRQSVVLQDDDIPSLHGHGGRGPRPPTMIERHRQAFANPPPQQPSYQTGYGHGASSNYNDFGPAPPPLSFIPGQIVPSAPIGQYANAAPFFDPSYQSHMPVGNVAYGSQGSPLTRGPSNAATSILTRGPSNGAASMLSRDNSIAQPPVAEADYADLSRASVTPYQAAQYAAISKQLNIAPPVPLPQVAEVTGYDESGHASKPSFSAAAKPSMDIISPFQDVGVGMARIEEFKPSRASSEFHAVEPSLPSQRITSIPPSLPELHTTSRVFSSADFPVTPSPCAATFDSPHASGGIDVPARPPAAVVAEPSPLGRASPKLVDHMPPLSPVTSSPQRAQLVSSADSSKHNGRETPVEIGFVRESSPGTPAPAYHELSSPVAAFPLPKAHAEPMQAKRPETMYDDEDAYGGF